MEVLFQTFLTEEGSASLWLEKGEYIKMMIRVGRTVNVTKYLPKGLVDSLEPGRHTLKEMKEEHVNVLDEIGRHPPRLILAEHEELLYRHRSQVPEDEWPDPVLSIVQKTKDGRVTAHRVLKLGVSRLVDLIHDHYGMLPGTWKAKVFEKEYRFYVNNRGIKLSDDKLKEFKELKEKNPP